MKTQNHLNKKLAPSKSPFFIAQDFISPLMCEWIVDSLGCYICDTDPEGKPLITTRRNEECQTVIFDKFLELIPTIEDYYNVEYKATEQALFQWRPEECIGDGIICENSKF